jgi:predicted amidohydrolase
LGNIGFVTCYDSWFPELFQLLALKGADIVLFPSVSFYFDMMYARAADNSLFIVAAAQGTHGNATCQ